MPFTVDRCAWLASDEAKPLLAAAASVDRHDAAALTRLRRRFTAEDVADALELLQARARAAGKFGELAGRLIADRVGVEQATGARVATAKARRLRGLAGGEAEAWDLCCGVGGDALGLAGEGFDVTVVDRDPARVWQAQRLVRLGLGREPKGVVADAETLAPPDDAVVHLDPDRRAGGRRRFDPRDYAPGLDFIEKLAERDALTAVKLAPGVDPAALPRGEVQWISDAGTLVQAVLYTGPVEPGVRATSLAASRDAAELHGEPCPPPVVDAPGRFVYEADPAAERARLLRLLCDRHGLAEARPGLGLLTGDAAVESTWLTGFAVLARLPWHANNPRKVRGELTRRHAGVVEVKTRDKACDPDAEQRRLRGRGDARLTVFVLRMGQRLEAWITKRLQKSE